MDAVSITKNQVFSASVAIVMPLYNRKHFLEQAFNSLLAQQYKDWALVIVDDGSTDYPLPKVKELFGGLEQQVAFVSQKNAGPGTARQTGVETLPNAKFYAFFDSDDEWTPDYLSVAIETLERNEDVDWVYQACRRIDHNSGETLLESTFQTQSGKPVPFFELRTEKRRELGVFIDNQAVLIEQIRRPLDAGFQNSVMRSSVLEKCEIPRFRIGEDRYFFSMALINDFKVAYLNRVGVLYHVHDSNISDTNSESLDYEKKINTHVELLKSYEALLLQCRSKNVEKCINSHIADLCFWHIGYNGYLQIGDVSKATKYMAKAIKLKPTHAKYYRTYIATLIKSVLNRS